MISRASWVSVVSGVVALLVAPGVLAQANTAENSIAAPEYGSGAAAGPMSNQNFNTPESDGRPGVKFFEYGVKAFRKGDYRHAIDMYRIAASWAYKPAEYNLGVMYFRGQGVAVDRPLGAAWMVLAAERGEKRYVHARDIMVTLLSKAEFAKTDALWARLKRTYGDEVALRRAKAQWAYVRTHQTGTRVGGATGELSVGVLGGGHTPVSLNASGKPMHVATTAAEILRDGSIDGSIAYRQFRQSDNPYDPVFLKGRNGYVTVEPLRSARPAAHPLPPDPAAPSSSHPPRSA